MFNFKEYQKIKNKIAFLGKNTEIIAISKNHPAQEVENAISRGLNIFGENRVQEAKTKFENLKKGDPSIELHLTGPLQTNKTKEAIKLFDIFHTLDREKLAKEFVKHGGLENKKFFVQVNTGKEKSKSGIFLEESSDFINYCKNDLRLNVIGLMCIPPINDNPIEHFSLLQQKVTALGLSGLSMGMSSDYKDAIKHNATYIRIGTRLFGNREK